MPRRANIPDTGFEGLMHEILTRITKLERRPLGEPYPPADELFGTMLVAVETDDDLPMHPAPGAMYYVDSTGTTYTATEDGTYEES